MATDYAEFIATVERHANVPHDQAERAVSATLETLSERVSGGESHDLAGQLPPELQELVDRHAQEDAQALSAQQFLGRVQGREHASASQVEAHVLAVFAALRESIPPAEIADLASQLPRDLEMLLFDDPARTVAVDGVPVPPPRDGAEFLGRVAQRTALDEVGARQATDAVLELLAFRLAAGESDDLAELLPDNLREPLERGKAQKPTPDADWLPLKQFLMAVAELEGVGRAEARLHVRAVFQTLAEAVGDDALSDVLSELPAEFRSLFPRPW